MSILHRYNAVRKAYYACLCCLSDSHKLVLYESKSRCRFCNVKLNSFLHRVRNKGESYSEIKNLKVETTGKQSVNGFEHRKLVNLTGKLKMKIRKMESVFYTGFYYVSPPTSVNKTVLPLTAVVWPFGLE